MWDFDSESEKVQDIQSDYLAALWNAGVRGFRMDAVKHIHTDSMKAIKEKFAKKIGVNADGIYWIRRSSGELLRSRRSIQPSNYVQNGTVTGVGFKSEMNQTFKDKIANLKGLNGRLSKDLASKTPTCSSPTGTPRATRRPDLQGRCQYPAHAFMLAYDYGTPRLLSAGGMRTTTAPGPPRIRSGREHGRGLFHQQLRLELRQRWTST